MSCNPKIASFFDYTYNNLHLIIIFLYFTVFYYFLHQKYCLLLTFMKNLFIKI